MSKKLLFPDDIRDFLARRFNSQHPNWLTDPGVWPLSVALGVPTEKDVTQDPTAVRGWVDAWATWKGVGELVWEERQWGRLGKQRLPARMVLTTPVQVAEAVRQGGRWKTATRRYQQLAERWPVLATTTALPRNFDVLADYADDDFERLFALLSWFDANPASGKYLRQLPVEGLDTKWIEKRRGLVMDMLQAIRGLQGAREFYSLCGLMLPRHRIRVRLLCQGLRRAVSGLRDIEAPIEELAALTILPSAVIIVENLETGVALPDIPGCIAFMKLGHAVSVLNALPWLRDAPVIYWGDIDTHGFAILDRARAVIPGLRSILMDEVTLLSYRSLWGQEPAQHPDVALSRLTENERVVYSGLQSNTWGQKVRLEQERVAWVHAMEAVALALQTTQKV